MVMRRSRFGSGSISGASLRVLRTAGRKVRSPIDRVPSAPEPKEDIMRIIFKVIESMLSKDATQTWTGQTSAASSRDVWGWGGISEQTATII